MHVFHFTMYISTVFSLTIALALALLTLSQTVSYGFTKEPCLLVCEGLSHGTSGPRSRDETMGPRQGRHALDFTSFRCVACCNPPPLCFLISAFKWHNWQQNCFRKADLSCIFRFPFPVCRRALDGHGGIRNVPQHRPIIKPAWASFVLSFFIFFLFRSLFLSFFLSIVLDIHLAICQHPWVIVYAIKSALSLAQSIFAVLCKYEIKNCP